jgi:hypothetical protein
MAVVSGFSMIARRPIRLGLSPITRSYDTKLIGVPARRCAQVVRTRAGADARAAQRRFTMKDDLGKGPLSIITIGFGLRVAKVVRTWLSGLYVLLGKLADDQLAVLCDDLMHQT